MKLKKLDRQLKGLGHPGFRFGLTANTLTPNPKPKSVVKLLNCIILGLCSRSGHACGGDPKRSAGIPKVEFESHQRSKAETQNASKPICGKPFVSHNGLQPRLYGQAVESSLYGLGKLGLRRPRVIIEITT